MKKVRVVGLGPGNMDYLLPKGKRAIEKSEIIVGGTRQIQMFDNNFIEKISLDGRYKEVMDFLKSNCGKYDIAVVVSGDTGFYSLSSMVKKNVPMKYLEFIPGISSLQYMFAKLCFSWENALLKSLHGRNFDYKEKLEEYKYIGLLTDKTNRPEIIAQNLMENGYGDKLIIHIGERLSYDDEKVTSVTLREAASGKYDTLSVVVIEKIEEKGDIL